MNPPLSVLLHSMLRWPVMGALVLRVAAMLGLVLAAREAWLRVRLAATPAGHRHHAVRLRRLARLVQVRAALADAAFWEDPRTLGKAAEVARCARDAGRRAIARVLGLLFACGHGMRPAAMLVAAAPSLEGRCSLCLSVA